MMDAVKGFLASLVLVPVFLLLKAYEWAMWRIGKGPKPEPEDFS